MSKPTKSTTRLDLVTHPVRLRILLALAGSELTASGIAAALDDVPASSIYRHLQILLDAGLLEVAAERRVRGAIEKTLRIAADAASFGPDEAARMTPDEHRRAFLVLFTQLFHELDRYLQRPESDLARDLVGYRTSAFYATDAEWLAAIEAINGALRPLLDQPPAPGRTRRRLATVSLVAPAEPEEDRS